eukprot:2631778-Prymnesium_polylepis.1
MTAVSRQLFSTHSMPAPERTITRSFLVDILPPGRSAAQRNGNRPELSASHTICGLKRSKRAPEHQNCTKPACRRRPQKAR